MALILNEKYTGKNSYKLFITNRFLRIYPLYWLVLVLSLIIFPFFINANGNTLASVISQYQLLHNFAFLKQLIIDVVRQIFLITNSSYFLPNNFQLDFLIVTQSWTLGVELIFYILAPFIVRRSTKQILILTIIFYIFRALTYRYFVTTISGRTNVNPAFFPSTAVFFLYGVVSYKIYVFLKQFKLPSISAYSMLFYIVLFTAFYYPLPIDSRTIYLISLIFFMPVVFAKFNKSRLDIFFGELSYPMYVSHSLVIFASFTLLSNFNKTYLSLIVFLLCVAFAIVLNKVIEIPIDKYRQSRIKKTKT